MRIISDAIDLTEDLEAFVSELVASGRYASRDAVLQDGIRLLQQRESVIASMRLKYLQGVAAADRGDNQRAADILSELRNEVAAMKLGTEVTN